MWEILGALSVAILGYIIAMYRENVKQSRTLIKQETITLILKELQPQLDNFERALKRMSRQIDNIQDQRRDDVDRLTKIMTALSGSPIAIELYRDNENKEEEKELDDFD